PRRAPAPPGRPRRFAPAELATALAVVALALVLSSETIGVRADFAFLARVLDLGDETVATRLYPVERLIKNLLEYGPPLAACLLLRRRPLALGLALPGLLAVG